MCHTDDTDDYSLLDVIVLVTIAVTTAVVLISM
jgi:hypothetical protein